MAPEMPISRQICTLVVQIVTDAQDDGAPGEGLLACTGVRLHYSREGLVPNASDCVIIL